MQHTVNLRQAQNIRKQVQKHMKTFGIRYCSLYSNKAATHPNAVHGYRMKFWGVVKAAKFSVSINKRVEQVNEALQLEGVPYCLQVVQKGSKHELLSYRIVPVSTAL